MALMEATRKVISNGLAPSVDKDGALILPTTDIKKNISPLLLNKRAVHVWEIYSSLLMEATRKVISNGLAPSVDRVGALPLPTAHIGPSIRCDLNKSHVAVAQV